MGRKPTKEKPQKDYIVVSYLDGERRVHRAKATSYRDAKSQVARDLREELGLWDVNLADITSQGTMIARKLPPRSI